MILKSLISINSIRIVILNLIFAIAILGCEKTTENNDDDDGCNIIELPVIVYYEGNNHQEMSIDIDQDCKKDLVFSVGRQHAASGFEQLFCEIGSSRDNVKIAYVEKKRKDNCSYTIDILVDSNDINIQYFGHELYDTLIREMCVYSLTSIDDTSSSIIAGKFPESFDFTEDIRNYTLWIQDDLSMRLFQRSPVVYGPTEISEKRFLYSNDPTVSYITWYGNMYAGIKIESNGENYYYGILISLEGWSIKIHDIIDLN